MWGRDPPNGYGWVSIALHWVTAVGIVVLLFAGVSISGESASRAIRLHTAVGTALYVVLWGRIVWRLACGHPPAANPSKPGVHMVGVFTHFAMLACLAVMLISGPLVAAMGQIPVSVLGLFDLTPLNEASPDAFQLLARIHGGTATVLGTLVAVHVLGVVKHLIFDRDGVLDRILIAAKPSAPEQTKL